MVIDTTHFEGRNEYDIPERNLWAAVLTAVFEDFIGYGSASSNRVRDQQIAYKYVTNRHSDFARVCRMLDLDPDKLRELLLNAKPEEMVRIFKPNTPAIKKDNNAETRAIG